MHYQIDLAGRNSRFSLKNMQTPIRVQINRRHKDPNNTKRVCRPSKFGNKFKVGQVANFDGIDVILEKHLEYAKMPIPNNAVAVELFEQYQLPQMDCSELQGKNLGCYCKLSEPCHADPLLIKANFNP